MLSEAACAQVGQAPLALPRAAQWRESDAPAGPRPCCVIGGAAGVVGPCASTRAALPSTHASRIGASSPAVRMGECMAFGYVEAAALRRCRYSSDSTKWHPQYLARRSTKERKKVPWHGTVVLRKSKRHKCLQWTLCHGVVPALEEGKALSKVTALGLRQSVTPLPFVQHGHLRAQLGADWDVLRKPLRELVKRAKDPRAAERMDVLEQANLLREGGACTHPKRPASGHSFGPWYSRLMCRDIKGSAPGRAKGATEPHGLDAPVGVRRHLGAAQLCERRHAAVTGPPRGRRGAA